MSITIPFEPAPAALQRYLHDMMVERSIPGLQVAVVRDGRIVALDALGVANLEHQLPVMETSIFSINSMAKAFTGVAVMQLVEGGVLDLSASISRYLDDLPEHWRTITVLQLATLTSGVPEIMVYTAESSVALIGDGSEQGAWQAAYAAPMQHPIGQGYSYTQTNYALLARIISRVSGKPFTDFVAERQFAAAGMINTSYLNDVDVLPGRANTYMSISVDGEATGRILNSHINWPHSLRAAAGLHSTAIDLAKWVIALRDGTLLKREASVERLLTVVPLHDGRPGLWGIGWLAGQSAAGRVPAPGGGAKAQIVLYPDGLAVVLLTNLLGAFPEHLAPVSGEAIDLGFIDPIAAIFGS